MISGPPATKWVQYGSGVLVFTCEHEAHPKSKDPEHAIDNPGVVSPTQTCDFWSGKNDYTKYGGYPQVCFNCFHSVGVEIKEEEKL